MSALAWQDLYGIGTVSCLLMLPAIESFAKIQVVHIFIALAVPVMGTIRLIAMAKNDL